MLFLGSNHFLYITIVKCYVILRSVNSQNVLCIRFVFAFLQSSSKRKIRLSGYGVELAVKKTEYKAVDDSKVKDDAAGKVQEADDANEDEVEGFLFGKLRFVLIKTVVQNLN